MSSSSSPSPCAPSSTPPPSSSSRPSASSTASPSSTSSSESRGPRGGFPFAFCGAILIVVALELVVRQLPARKLIPYRAGLDEHFAVASYISDVGRADVGLVGSSMTRSGIAAPQIRRELAAMLGRTPYIANYGASGATADEMAAIVRYMARHDAVPSLLLYEVTPQQFQLSTSFRLRKVAIFWNFRDWLGAFRADPRQAVRVLPIVARNHLGQLCHAFRYRDRLRHWTAEKLNLAPRLPAPMAGALPENWHSAASLASASPRRRQHLIDRWAQANLRGGQFNMTDGLIADFEGTLAFCRDRGIPLVLYEMPLSDPARKMLPPDVYPQFHQCVSTLAARYGFAFHALDDLHVQLGDEHFADASHMNRRGATVLTRALAQRAIVPLFASQVADEGPVE